MKEKLLPSEDKVNLEEQSDNTLILGYKVALKSLKYNSACGQDYYTIN